MWILKGILLGTWLFIFGTIAMVLYLAVFRRLPGWTIIGGTWLFIFGTIIPVFRNSEARRGNDRRPHSLRKPHDPKSIVVGRTRSLYRSWLCARPLVARERVFTRLLGRTPGDRLNPVGIARIIFSCRSKTQGSHQVETTQNYHCKSGPRFNYSRVNARNIRRATPPRSLPGAHCKDLLTSPGSFARRSNQ